jgi:hypothetical protein
MKCDNTHKTTQNSLLPFMLVFFARSLKNKKGLNLHIDANAGNSKDSDPGASLVSPGPTPHKNREQTEEPFTPMSENTN